MSGQDIVNAANSRFFSVPKEQQTLVYKLGGICVLILILFFLLAPVQSRADEWWPITTVTCISEVNFFMVYTASLHSDVPDGDSKILGDQYKQLERRHNILTNSNHETHICKLKNATIKFQINYMPLKERGECGGDFNAKVKLWRDNELMLDLKNYDYDCDAAHYINNIVYKHFPSNGGNGQLFIGGIYYHSNVPNILNLALWTNEFQFPLTDEKIFLLEQEGK